MTYGIFDKTDTCWIGNDEGPLTFTSFLVARLAAQTLETQVFKTDLGCRYKAKEFVRQPLRLRDKVDSQMTPLDALRRIEGGSDEGSAPLRLAYTNTGWKPVRE